MADEKTPEEVEEAVAKEAAESKPAPKKRSRARAKPAAKKDAEKVEEAAGEEASESKPAAAEKPKRSRAKKPAAAKAEEKPTETKKPAAKAKPAAEPTDAAPPVVRAKARYVRTSARKARLVCDHIRGKSVEDARAILQYTPRHVARDWQKLLESAVANAEHNHELVGEDLRIVSVHADEGPTLKRFRPRAMGRATQIRKRTSHLSISLTPKEPR
jgi:ribosomal protein L22